MTKEITAAGITKDGKTGSKIIEAEIISNTEIADQIYRITLRYGTEAADARPGQFVNVYLRDGSMLLPRPVSICLAEEVRITLVYRVVGKGTKALSGHKAGDTIRVSTPLGHGYDIDAVFRALEQVNPDPKAIALGKNDQNIKTIALVAGGLGVPPMAQLAKAVRKRIDQTGSSNRSVRLIGALGFQETPFLAEELETYCDAVHIATETGSAGYHGNVLQMMEAQRLEADYYLSCGPKPMLKALSGICGRLGKPLQVSMEERMGCGYGACVGCTCRTKETEDGAVRVKQKKVCKDGPVFYGNEVVWDE